MSLIYNVTIKVDHSIADEWIQWLQQEHIPEVLATGCFSGARTMRLLEVDETEGLTYAVQYEAASAEEYNLYISEFATALRNKSFQKWGDKFIAFRSVLQIVN